MRPSGRTSSRRLTERWAAVSAAIIGVAALIYAFGRPDRYTPLLVVVLLFAAFGGYHFRVRPEVRAWRAAYILGFSCWVELAVLGVLVAAIALTPFGALFLAIPDLPRFALTFLPGFIGGGALGDFVGRRRGYAPPNLPFWM